MRLTLELRPHVVKELDRVVRGDMHKEPDEWSRSAVLVNLMLARAHQLHKGGRQEAGDGAVADGNRQRIASRTIDRLRQSRDRYRDLAARAEAALLGVPVREDYGSLERRLQRAQINTSFSRFRNLYHQSLTLAPWQDVRVMLIRTD